LNILQNKNHIYLELDEIKKNRVMEQPEEKFTLKDKILLNNDISQNNLGKSLNEKKNTEQKRNQINGKNNLMDINDKVIVFYIID